MATCSNLKIVLHDISRKHRILYAANCRLPEICPKRADFGGLGVMRDSITSTLGNPILQCPTFQVFEGGSKSNAFFLSLELLHARSYFPKRCDYKVL